MKVHESGSLWNGDTYNICSNYGHFVLEVNGKFHCSGDNLLELYEEIEKLNRAPRSEKIQQLN